MTQTILNKLKKEIIVSVIEEHVTENTDNYKHGDPEVWPMNW